MPQAATADNRRALFELLAEAFETMPPAASDLPAALAVVVDRLDKAGGRGPVSTAPGAGLSASALLRIVADGNPQELRAWAEANSMAAPILTALRGGSAATWQHAAEYRGAVTYVQAEIVRLALRRMGQAADEP
jgi:hypothetical protein